MGYDMFCIITHRKFMFTYYLHYNSTPKTKKYLKFPLLKNIYNFAGNKMCAKE